MNPVSFCAKYLLLFTDLLFPAVSEPQVHRIETKTAPKPSQPELILSDGKFRNLFGTLILKDLQKIILQKKNFNTCF